MLEIYVKAYTHKIYIFIFQALAFNINKRLILIFYEKSQRNEVNILSADIHTQPSTLVCISHNSLMIVMSSKVIHKIKQCRL